MPDLGPRRQIGALLQYAYDMRRLIALLFLPFFLLAFAACGAVDTVNDARDSVNNARDTVDNVQQAADEFEQAGRQAEELQQRFEDAKKATYTAKYETVDSGGVSATFTVAQDGSGAEVLAYFEDDETLVIDDGKTVTVCAKPSENSDDDTLSCFESASAGDGTGISLYAGGGFFVALASLTGLSAGVELVGGETTTFEATFDGEDADCTRIELPEGADVIESCVLKSVAIAGRYSSESEGTTYELTDFSNDVDSELFKLPANAKVN